MKATEIKIVYKAKVKAKDRIRLSSSQSVHEFLKKVFDKDTIGHIESSYLLMLNRQNEVLGYTKLSEGGLSSCIIDSKVVFQYAIKSNSSAIILAHNHPSGQMKASPADKNITNKIKTVGIALDLPIIDHIIMSPDNDYYSFSDEGLL
jgi:DNA repair protein RadC|tara:strand:- start:57 stop:500 length:444 start_codon:yes stop_codon:yes gene_type:complete